jgi:hypothetical protein
MAALWKLFYLNFGEAFGHLRRSASFADDGEKGSEKKGSKKVIYLNK